MVPFTRRGNAPEFSATEVAFTMLTITVWAQRSHLITCPPFMWQTHCSQAKVTEAACNQAAVNTRPVECRFVTESEHVQCCHQEARNTTWYVSFAAINNMYYICLRQIGTDSNAHTHTHTHTHTHSHKCFSCITRASFNKLRRSAPLKRTQKNIKLSNVDVFARQRTEELRRARVQLLQQDEQRCCPCETLSKLKSVALVVCGDH